MTQGSDLQEFRSAFVDEAEELLSSAHACLAALEEAARGSRTNGRVVRELFRAVHTVKGLAAMVGVEPIVEISHRLETTLRNADRSGAAIDAAGLDVLQQGIHAIQQRVRAVAADGPVAPAPAALLEAIDCLAGTTAAAAAPTPVPRLALDDDVATRLSSAEQDVLLESVGRGMRVVRADFTPSPARAEAGLNITSVRARAGTIGDVVKVIPVSVAASADAPGGLRFALFIATHEGDEAVAAAIGIEVTSVRAVAEAGTAEAVVAAESLEPDDATISRAGVVRVDIARIDDTMDRLSALIVTRFRLVRAIAGLAREGVNVRALQEIMVDDGRQMRELRAAILRVRLVRVADVFARVPLLVRQLGRATGKQVRLETDFGDAEVDKGVAEQLFPALVHLIRNAVDHGIEPAEARVRAGKAPEARLAIACFERTNSQLELSISDDGAGIDRQALARKAKAVEPESDAALLELLCMPGLSTREQADTTSGRGMGMDIVKRTIEQLGGELTLRTLSGAGTRFVVRVPLTLSIIDTFAFACGEQQFVTPVAAIEEVLDLERVTLTRAPHGRTTQVFERRGEVVPLVALATLFGVPTDAPAGKALVVRRNGAPFAFAVERMLGQQEVVVRPFTDPLLRVSGVSGATDLGDGRPTLVLDLGGLAVARVGREERAA